MSEFILDVKIECDENDKTLCGKCEFLRNHHYNQYCHAFGDIDLWARSDDVKRCDECLRQAVPVGARTNFDEITESPEALAEFINERRACNFCIHENEKCSEGMCKDGILTWLNQPAEESGVNENDEV
jgi:hypothetical protein